MMQERSIG